MTPNREDYLKCLYKISTSDKKITNKEIAEQMGVSKPAVTEMLKKLISEDYVVKKERVGYCLTDPGLFLVSNLYRKHRLIEVFLTHHLHYTADEVHQEAEVLEHTVSEHFVRRLDELLGFPKTCPHGSMIPAEGALLKERYNVSLYQAKEHIEYRLVRLEDDIQLLTYLEDHQLHLGDELQLVSRDSYTQTVRIKLSDQSLSLPFLVAKQLYVQQIKP